MANPQIVVEYVAKLDKLNKAQSQVGAQGSKVGGVLRKGLVPAVAVLGAMGVAMGKSTQAAQEAETASKRLDAVFKAQGESTSEASDAAQAYAETLSAKIGVDDEVIKGSQAIIATFRKVSDETARNAGIFDRTTAAAADLAAAGFGEMDGNAKALAKALQDPATGLSKLAKAGVSFTASEEKRIKALQASGQLTKAQKVLLEAVEKQVGGTAEATATNSEKMNVAYGELQETLGAALLPAFQRLVAIGTRVASFFARHPALLMVVVGAITALAAAVILANAAMAIAAVVATAWALPVLAVVAAIVALIAVGILVWKKWDVISAGVSKAFDKIKAAAAAVIGWLKSNWPKIVAVLAGPIGVAIYMIVRNWDKLKAVTKAAMSTLATIIKAPWEAAKWLADKIKSVLTSLVDWLRGLAGKVRGAMSTVGTALKGPLNAIIGAWNALRIPGFSVDINMPGPVPDIDFSWGGYNLPDIPKLAQGAIVTRPTLAMVGEAGPEAVLPLSGAGAIEVRVFIGDTELRGIVRTEVSRNNSATARMLMAGSV